MNFNRLCSDREFLGNTLLPRATSKAQPDESALAKLKLPILRILARHNGQWF